MPNTNRRTVPVAPSSDVVEGHARVFEVDGLRIAVCRAGGKVYAVEDRCTHDDGPLGDGHIEGHSVECPRHGARFDIRTGAVLRMPAVFPVRTFPVVERDAQILVEIDE